MKCFDRITKCTETPDPVVKIMNLTIRSPDREDMVPWFTLKEGSKYTLVFTFRVTNNIVSGLRYSNTVWKTGIKGIFISSRTRLPQYQLQ